MKIIIVGAGIAGLTLGLACQRAGFDVKIYEKAKQLENIGGGLLLWPHAMRYLNDLGLMECLQAVHQSAIRMNLVGHRGQAILRDDHAEIYSLMNGEIFPIDRSELQQRFAALLADNILHLGASCTEIINHEDYAAIRFADGRHDCADLIVGADGVYSTVRKFVAPTREPVYAGFCWWGGVVNRTCVPHFASNEQQTILGQNRLCSVWPTHGEKFMWYLPVKMPLAEFDHEGNGQAQVEALCRDWHPDVMRLVTAPHNEQRFHLPIYELPISTQTTLGRIVLIGDAACASGPLLGQGANKAIEDAYVLVKRLLRKENDIPAMLSHYDSLRFARRQRFLELEHLSVDALMHGSVEALTHFESQLPSINLVMMYQDMIPLVNQAAYDQFVLEVV
jgi:2-polyprenyl-6-methoxyphenol hydroxylase-like FAD-dependent oxidoreductase